jgi:hypothetical protein
MWRGLSGTSSPHRSPVSIRVSPIPSSGRDGGQQADVLVGGEGAGLTGDHLGQFCAVARAALE